MFNCDLICNPFGCSSVPFTGKTMEEFNKLSNNCNLKLEFTSHDFSKFWLNVENEYTTKQEKL